MHATITHIDGETKSAAHLRKTGAHKYAAHHTTGIWCLAYAFDDEEVHIWTPDREDPEDLLAHVASGGTIAAHNAAFELAVWRHVLTDRLGWPELRADQCQCTMAKALSLGLPASLDGAAKAVQLPVKKDKDGAYLMRRMASGGDWDQESIDRLIQYCVQDVKVERALEKKMG